MDIAVIINLVLARDDLRSYGTGGEMTLVNSEGEMKRKEADIVDILRYWEGHDAVPEELSQYLAVAADEIAGLRAENDYLKKEMDAAEYDRCRF